jgi:hypothetical protein
MYWTVPTTIPGFVLTVAGCGLTSNSCDASLASPKSSTFTIPSRRSMTFSGLISRCTIPALKTQRARLARTPAPSETADQLVASVQGSSHDQALIPGEAGLRELPLPQLLPRVHFTAALTNSANRGSLRNGSKRGSINAPGRILRFSKRFLSIANASSFCPSAA